MWHLESGETPTLSLRLTWQVHWCRLPTSVSSWYCTRPESMIPVGCGHHTESITNGWKKKKKGGKHLCRSKYFTTLGLRLWILFTFHSYHYGLHHAAQSTVQCPLPPRKKLKTISIHCHCTDQSTQPAVYHNIVFRDGWLSIQWEDNACPLELALDCVIHYHLSRFTSANLSQRLFLTNRRLGCTWVNLVPAVYKKDHWRWMGCFPSNKDSFSFFFCFVNISSLVRYLHKNCQVILPLFMVAVSDSHIPQT